MQEEESPNVLLCSSSLELNVEQVEEEYKKCALTNIAASDNGTEK
jgi:hypothetical protein